MDDHGLLHLGKEAAVDLRVVVRALPARSERAARHQDDPAPHRLDERALLLVRRLDVRERHTGPGLEEAGAPAPRTDGAGEPPCSRNGPPSQLLRTEPSDS